jgi:hypothetical protein
MGMYLWCAIGAILGWVASRIGPQGFVAMIESVAVGVFFSFLGGEFLPAMVLVSPAGGAGITPVTVAMAVGGAVAGLLLLGFMRGAVGPMKPHKKKRPS